MKILTISNMYPSKKDPVYGTFVRNFYEDLKVRNKNGINNIVCIKGRSKSKLVKLCKYIYFICNAFLKLIFNNYDIVYVHTITFTILPIKAALAFKPLPLVFNTHGVDVITRGKISSKLKQIASTILPKSLLIVVPSEYFKKVVLHEFSILEDNHIYISPSGGISNSFFTFNHNDEYNPKHKLHLGYVSRIDPGKGWDVLIKAMKNLKDNDIPVKLTIAGRGADESDLINTINQEELTDIIDFIGPISQDKLPDLYRTFDLFIFPTTSLSESLGLVGIEAMASGVPVICSDMAGPGSYVVNNYNGYKFEPGNSDELTVMIKKYMNLELKDKIRLKNGALETAEQYMAENVNDRLFMKLVTLIGH